MNKILIAFDDRHFSEGAMNFLIRLNEMQPLLLTGIFLSEPDYARAWSYYTGSIAAPALLPYNEKINREAIQKNIERFEKVCRHNDIDYRTRKTVGDLALQELKKETRFADTCVIGSEVFYKNFGTDQPNEYLQDALHYAECPVLLVPEKFDFPETNILAYDGSESSIYAIKQYACIFPEMSKKETLLVFAKEEIGTSLPDDEYIKELAACHYNDLTLMKLHSNSKKEFNDWIKNKKGSILVSGAFGRSVLSQLFRKSFIAGAISDHQLPIFVSHR